MRPVELIPRSVLFGNPDRVFVTLSPDGERLAYLAPLDGVLNVWVASVDGPEDARPVTRDHGRGIQTYAWAYTDDHILYLQDVDGDENWRAICVTLSTGEVVDLTPQGVRARLQLLSPLSPDEVLIELNDRDPRYSDLYRVRIPDGRRQMIQRNDGFMGFLADDRFGVRLGVRTTAAGALELMAPHADGWRRVDGIPAEDAMSTHPLGLDTSGRILYLFDSRGRDTAALVAWDLASGERMTLAEDPRSDASGVWIHPRTRRIQAVAFTYERQRWEIVDEAVAPDLERLQGVIEGELKVVSRCLDDRRWIACDRRAQGATRYYLYDRTAEEVRFLFVDRDGIERATLASVHPRVIAARDGLPLVSYLTLPPDRDVDGDGVPDAPLPMVLWVHGGPWGRDIWMYHPDHQWLANRGYAVLAANFRGSTGFGKRFVNAGDRQWAADMHRDLLDAVDWAVDRGIADPERVAIGGGSYGGYATLVGMTDTPDVFACGVDIVGPSNLITLLKNIPPYWTPMLPLLAQRIGDPSTDEGQALLRERSPLFRVDRIRKPLLIGQGANDPRVKRSESDHIVDAMRQRGIPVTYVVYQNEGHGFVRPENRLSFMAIAEAFLAPVLGGRAEPFGDDTAGASAEVVTGAEFVPGLETWMNSA